MRVSMVVAVSVNGVIGRDGDLPWRLSADLKWFKKTTMGKPLIMGRKTFESIGKPLPGRTNIVLTRRSDFAPDSVKVASTPTAALILAKDAAQHAGVDEVCVIGGGEIYRQFASLADRIYLTVVHAAIEGDANFSGVDWCDWRAETVMQVDPDEKNEFSATMLVLDRLRGTAA